jgi:hypothetical protein
VAANHDVIRKFRKRLETTIASHKELLLAIHNKRNEASLETLLSEQFVLLVTVFWEAFVNDLVIAYVTIDPRVCVRNIRLKIVQSITDRHGSEASRALRFSFPPSLTRARAAALLDPRKWNLTFDSAQTLASRTNAVIAVTHAKKFVLNAEDSQFLDYALGLRNYLSHRSAGSREILRARVTELSGASNACFKASTSNVGTYLKHKDAAGNSRAVLIAERFRLLSAGL